MGGGARGRGPGKVHALPLVTIYAALAMNLTLGFKTSIPISEMRPLSSPQEFAYSGLQASASSSK